ncbi:MAG: bifunctional transaldolase/phosoglucose isomerase, partial [Bacteroidia bacterium]
QWEIATAIAGMVIGVNPFDQPNVTESKKNTNNILDEWIHEGSFKTSTPLLERGEIKIFAGKKVQELSEKHINSIGDFMDSFLNSACLHDYIALLPYFSLTSDRTKMMDAWREEMKSDLKEATTLLNGPRYLHSTGQLHKGGPDSGLYILLVGEEKEELEIPGQKYGFGTLHQAQALGDFRSLDDKERRVVLIRLGKDIDAGLKILMNAVQKKNIQFT